MGLAIMAPDGIVSNERHVTNPAAVRLVLGMNPLMS